MYPPSTGKDQELEEAIRDSLRSDTRYFERRGGQVPLGALIQNRFEGFHCFWLITTGRSGTTTLTRILEHIPNIDAAHEPFPELFYEGRLAIEGNPMPEEYSVRLPHAPRSKSLTTHYFSYKVNSMGYFLLILFIYRLSLKFFNRYLARAIFLKRFCFVQYIIATKKG